ncbi:DUF397 domain-containing protein [Kribbella sp. NPDC059898]|uniref:DUF397 domain-containing protein n=1 Tax=Kribbella sp. NPDC059898 TaxID=3346995 RepID=UPI00364E42A6
MTTMTGRAGLRSEFRDRPSGSMRSLVERRAYKADEDAEGKPVADLTGVQWHKSTRSAPNNNCVEAGLLADGGVAVRDTKQGDTGPILEFTKSEWVAFLDGAKRGEFDIVHCGRFSIGRLLGRILRRCRSRALLPPSV